MTDQIEKDVKSILSTERYEHSLRTAGMAAELCDRFGLDAMDGCLAGITHDIAREFPEKEMIRLAAGDSIPITETEQRHPVLLHGRTGAVLLRERYGVRNIKVLNAVRWHTTGHPEMGKLEQILYCADYLEPGRNHISMEEREKLICLPLPLMVLSILEKELEYLNNRNMLIAENSIFLYDALKYIKG